MLYTQMSMGMPGMIDRAHACTLRGTAQTPAVAAAAQVHGLRDRTQLRRGTPPAVGPQRKCHVRQCHAYQANHIRGAQNRTRKWHTRQRLSSSSSRLPTSCHLHRYELTDKLLNELDPLFPAAFPFWHLGKPSHSRLPTTHVHYTHTPVYYASDGSGR